MFGGGRSTLGDSRADSRGFSRGLRACFLLWGEPGARYARGDSPFDAWEIVQEVLSIFGGLCKKVWGEPGVCMFGSGRSTLGDSRADFA
jgi:hypothetical protein